MTDQEISKLCFTLIKSAEIAQRGGNGPESDKVKQDILSLIPQVRTWADNGNSTAQYALFRAAPHSQQSRLSESAKGGCPHAMLDWAICLTERGELEIAATFLAKILKGEDSFLKDEVRSLLDGHSKLSQYTESKLNPVQTHFFSQHNGFITSLKEDTPVACAPTA